MNAYSATEEFENSGKHNVRNKVFRPKKYTKSDVLRLNSLYLITGLGF